MDAETFHKPNTRNAVNHTSGQFMIRNELPFNKPDDIFMISGESFMNEKYYFIELENIVTINQTSFDWFSR